METASGELESQSNYIHHQLATKEMELLTSFHRGLYDKEQDKHFCSFL